MHEDLDKVIPDDITRLFDDLVADPRVDSDNMCSY